MSARKSLLFSKKILKLNGTKATHYCLVRTVITHDSSMPFACLVMENTAF